MAALRAWGLCGGTGSGQKLWAGPMARTGGKSPAPVAVPGLVLSGYPRSDLGKPVLTAEPAPLRFGSGSLPHLRAGTRLRQLDRVPLRRG